MFKTYGVCVDTNGELTVITGQENQSKEDSKDLYYMDGSLGGICLDGGEDYKLHEMDWNDAEFKDLVETFKSGTFLGMGGVIAVENDNGDVSYIGISDMEIGDPCIFYENAWTVGLPIDVYFLPTDADGDIGYSEHLAYTCNGQVF